MIHCLLVYFLFWTPLALAEDAPVVGDYRSHLDQARFFIKKRWLEDARSELLLASKNPNGRLDPEVWFLLSHLEFQRCDIDAAREAIELAHTHATIPEEFAQVQVFKELLKQGFGWVRLPTNKRRESPNLVLKTPLFSELLKEYITRLQSRLDKGKPLPDRVGLPAGAYEFNGWAFDIEASEETPSEHTKREDMPQRWQAHLGLGGGGWTSPSLSHLRPYGQLQAGLGFSHHKWILEAATQWSPQPFATRDGRVSTQWISWGGSLHLGVQIKRSSWGLQIMGGYRVAVLQPVELQCEQDESSLFNCGDTESQDLLIYPRSLAHLASVALRLQYTKTRWTYGITVYPEYAMGRVSSSGQAQFVDSGEEIRYKVESNSRTWHSLGVRSTLQISRSF